WTGWVNGSAASGAGLCRHRPNKPLQSCAKKPLLAEGLFVCVQRLRLNSQEMIVEGDRRTPARDGGKPGDAGAKLHNIAEARRSVERGSFLAGSKAADIGQSKAAYPTAIAQRPKP